MSTRADAARALQQALTIGVAVQDPATGLPASAIEVVRVRATSAGALHVDVMFRAIWRDRIVEAVAATCAVIGSDGKPWSGFPCALFLHETRWPFSSEECSYPQVSANALVA